ncbi:MAG: hypothetical protein V1656_01590 [Candidatus Jorgensenbacteria bacterium]
MIPLDLRLHFQEQLLADQRLMLPRVEVPAPARVLEGAVVEGILDDEEDIAEREVVVALRAEIQLVFLIRS